MKSPGVEGTASSRGAEVPPCFHDGAVRFASLDAGHFGEDGKFQQAALRFPFLERRKKELNLFTTDRGKGAGLLTGITDDLLCQGGNRGSAGTLDRASKVLKDSLRGLVI